MSLTVDLIVLNSMAGDSKAGTRYWDGGELSAKYPLSIEREVPEGPKNSCRNELLS